MAKSVLQGAGEVRVHWDSWERKEAELRAAEKFCQAAPAAIRLFFSPTVAKMRQGEKEEAEVEEEEENKRRSWFFTPRQISELKMQQDKDTGRRAASGEKVGGERR